MCGSIYKERESSGIECVIELACVCFWNLKRAAAFFSGKIRRKTSMEAKSFHVLFSIHLTFNDLFGNDAVFRETRKLCMLCCRLFSFFSLFMLCAVVEGEIYCLWIFLMIKWLEIKEILVFKMWKCWRFYLKYYWEKSIWLRELKVES